MEVLLRASPLLLPESISTIGTQLTARMKLKKTPTKQKTNLPSPQLESVGDVLHALERRLNRHHQEEVWPVPASTAAERLKPLDRGCLKGHPTEMGVARVGGLTLKLRGSKHPPGAPAAPSVAVHLETNLGKG